MQKSEVIDQYFFNVDVNSFKNKEEEEEEEGKWEKFSNWKDD